MVLYHKMKKIKKVLGALRRADQDYGLIENNDHIVVGVSGGKDSLTLLYALGLYRKFSKKDFRITGIYIDVGFGEEGFENVVHFFEQYNISLIRVETRIKNMLEQHLHNGELNCHLCSRLKKGTLIKEAKDRGAIKIALGHHADDAMETLLLNMIYGGKMETMPFKRYMTREEVYVIRPLLYATEQDIIDTAKELELPVLKSKCPRDKHSQRESMKQLLNELYKKYPEAHSNFLKSLENEEQRQLWIKEFSNKEK